MPSRLILFDIDGTLLSTRGLGREAIDRAVREVYGIADSFRDICLAGRTDIQIVHEALRRASVPEDRIRDGLPNVLARHAEILDALFRERGPGYLMPGFPALLDRLAEDPSWGIGLLTGNARLGARIKLASLGLWSRFAFGAFGDDHEDRNALPAVALRRARETLGAQVTPAACTVVGDTTRDIACARAGGMRAAAVATGWDTYETLRASRPDHLFRSFADTEDALRRLGALTPPIPREEP